MKAKELIVCIMYDIADLDTAEEYNRMMNYLQENVLSKFSPDSIIIPVQYQNTQVIVLNAINVIADEKIKDQLDQLEELRNMDFSKIHSNIKVGKDLSENLRVTRNIKIHQ